MHFTSSQWDRWCQQWRRRGQWLKSWNVGWRANSCARQAVRWNEPTSCLTIPFFYYNLNFGLNFQRLANKRKNWSFFPKRLKIHENERLSLERQCSGILLYSSTRLLKKRYEKDAEVLAFLKNLNSPADWARVLRVFSRATDGAKSKRKKGQKTELVLRIDTGKKRLTFFSFVEEFREINWNETRRSFDRSRFGHFQPLKLGRGCRKT